MTTQQPGRVIAGRASAQRPTPPTFARTSHHQELTMARYACHDCDATFDAPTDTATAGCPGCGELVGQDQPGMPRAYPDCERCGDTGLDPENANEPCHGCQPCRSCFTATTGQPTP
ncbi:hypothetical protein ACFWHL_16310 [Streptomyces massasporeus]